MLKRMSICCLRCCITSFSMSFGTVYTEAHAYLNEMSECPLTCVGILIYEISESRKSIPTAVSDSEAIRKGRP